MIEGRAYTVTQVLEGDTIKWGFIMLADWERMESPVRYRLTDMDYDDEDYSAPTPWQVADDWGDRLHWWVASHICELSEEPDESIISVTEAD